MGWARKSLPAKRPEQEPALVGIDLDATQARAVHAQGQALPLDDERDALPMVLSLAGSQPEVGQAGASLCRLAPHLACLDFLAHLGQGREWVAGRHRLDAAKALALVFERLRSPCAGAAGMVLSVPAYLTRAQAALLRPLAEKARLPLLGSVRAPLASAWAAHAAEPWLGLALVVDADDHAVSAATVLADGEQLAVHAAQSWPHLNLRAWKGRLLDAIADRCIRQSRRDPRDSAPAEQALYEQFDDALDAARQGRMVEFLIQSARWYQNLLLRPEELSAFCDRLVRRVVDGLQALLESPAARDALSTVFVTASAGRLPGLVPALENLAAGPLPAADAASCDDFGEALLAGSRPGRVTVLAADAAARAAHQLAARFHRGELAAGHLDGSVPLPRASRQPAPAPPKRTLRLLAADPE